MPRFILLEHTGAPDDPTGRHVDLLLEDRAACRTWRLADLPAVGAAPVDAVELPPHRLAWLEHDAGEVSGGRGFTRRIDAGTFEPSPPQRDDRMPDLLLDVVLQGGAVTGRLVVQATAGRCVATLHPRHPRVS